MAYGDSVRVEYRIALYREPDGFTWYDRPARPPSYRLCSYPTNLIWISNDKGKKKPGLMGSTAFFCSPCADIWAWRSYMHLPLNWPKPEWHTLNRRCPYHGGGSLVLDWATYRLADQLPIELLKWELENSLC